jgi:hypothetical protein
MSRGESKDDGARKNLYRFTLHKNFQRNFEKPLDKSQVLWYNINVKERAELIKTEKRK